MKKDGKLIQDIQIKFSYKHPCEDKMLYLTFVLSHTNPMHLH